MLHSQFTHVELAKACEVSALHLNIETAIGATSIRALDQSGLPARFRRGGPITPGLSKSRAQHLIVKRALDILCVLIGLFALVPIMALIALAIRATSPGPALFCQEREGFGGRVFRIYKFRTLRAEACDAAGLRPVRKNDPGLTWVGARLRKFSLDELPQIFNILKGDMSLVGPRPHVRAMRAGRVSYDSLVPYYPVRHVMRPGLTGWAQANGLRGPVTAENARARVDHDIAYLQNFSIWLDLKILTLTALRMMSGKLRA